ncbi:MAG: hypothetical protein LBC94_09775 [Desulfovibrio sp.]|jgi:hypothetical protein|nr:hypothetical protein [Desulfovibrio sp.]
MRPVLLCCAIVFCCCGSGRAAAIEGDALADEGAFKAMPEPGEQPDWRLGGFAESRNEFAVHDMERPVSLQQRMQLEFQWKKDVFGFFGSLEGIHEGAVATWAGNHSPWRGGVREVYVTYDTERFDVFLGRKIHRWGTGDGINPMDIINPVDTRDPFSSGRADNRVPAWMVSATLAGDGVSLEGIFLPQAAVARLPEKGEPWEPAALRDLRERRDSGHFSLDTSGRPHEWFENMEYGGRLNAALWGWDVSLMAFRGYLDTPVFQLEAGAKPEVGLVYPMFTAFGAAFAKGFGKQSVRGEMACKPAYPVQDDAGFIRTDLWQGVLGWDYDMDSRYYLNVQYFVDYYQRSTSATSTAYHGAAYEISGKWLRDALKTGVRGKVYGSGDGALTELFLEYELDDHWKFFTGIMWWAGGEDTILGEYRKNNFFYATVRFSF